jgi:hypothetical protein
MKRIIALILIGLLSALIIAVCIDVRGSNRTNEVKAEMLSRIKILSEETDIICSVEFTPFIWDKEYIYGGYSTPKEFQELIGDKNIDYIETSEFDHRELYFKSESVIYDTRKVGRKYWCTFFKNTTEQVGILYPDDWLEVVIGEKGAVYLYAGGE